MGLLEKGLSLMRSSATLEHVSYSGYSLVLKASLAFTKNSDLCLQFLRRCADYKETVAAFYAPPIISPASSHVESLDLRDRAMQPQFETTSVSAESTTRVKGLFRTVHAF